eukprot:TRINITY_DN12966_c0_g1_i1.p1 TRINITY_DN12966_c0_g1~~TRINITY_DN12966_c0_g1_i1.p1  ORF type:complete len:252 (+),score=97.24 TRINITY_DN12966_c0_g1_i1:75-758(+)
MADDGANPLNGVDLVEAKAYLQKHGVHVLFEKLAAELIREMPAAPLDYIAKRVDDIRRGGVKAQVVLVFGPPGSGKTALCKSAEGGDVTHIDFTGRDDPAEDIIAELAAAPSRAVLVEGFPRNMTDVLSLQKVTEPRLIVRVAAQSKACEKRLFKRAFAANGDVTLDSVTKAMAAYSAAITPVLTYYEAWVATCGDAASPERVQTVKSSTEEETSAAFAAALKAGGL